MECEKYEPLLLDELYEELDEVTSAAVKRHVSGCARCASALNGMRATRRLAALPLEPAPAGLEDRILSAARDAAKVVPIESRMSRAVSWAGRWAMRPQTAMAAMFLLMIGSSAFLIRAKKDASRPAAVSVTVEGTPEPQPAAEAADTTALNSPAAAAAHGAVAASGFATPPPAASAVAQAAAAPTAVAANDPWGGPMDRATGGALRDKTKDLDEESALGSIAPAKEDQNDRAEKKAPITNAGLPGGAGDYGQAAQAPAPPPRTAAKRGTDAQDGYSAGMALYRARNFADATKQFDSAAASGDQNSALWAAKSVKEGSGGCGAALPRFLGVAQNAGSSWIGSEASLEAARCQIALGQLDAARDRLQKLANSSTHGQQAQQALNDMNQVAQRRADADHAKKGGAGGGGAAATRAAPAPMRAPAPATKPAAGASESAY